MRLALFEADSRSASQSHLPHHLTISTPFRAGQWFESTPLTRLSPQSSDRGAAYAPWVFGDFGRGANRPRRRVYPDVSMSSHGPPQVFVAYVLSSGAIVTQCPPHQLREDRVSPASRFDQRPKARSRHKEPANS